MATDTSIRWQNTTARRDESSASSPPAFGRVALSAGVEDALAAVRTAVLLARTFGSSLHLHVFGMESLEIHFGQARCEGLLAGLEGSLRERLMRASAASPGGFSVQIDFFELPVISLFIHHTEATLK